jgi:hypothetical protein
MTENDTMTLWDADADNLIDNVHLIEYVTFDNRFCVRGFWIYTITLDYWNAGRTVLDKLTVYQYHHMSDRVDIHHYNQLLSVVENMTKMPIEDFTNGTFGYIEP